MATSLPDQKYKDRCGACGFKLCLSNSVLVLSVAEIASLSFTQMAPDGPRWPGHDISAHTFMKGKLTCIFHSWSLLCSLDGQVGTPIEASSIGYFKYGGFGTS
ncbi:hypothetical protein SAY87_001787 [Trapa incisa]|uniref:Uncharacterized protein n=1 Tax=Trapa incisa TaxID=236973 RepID=A0AAN7JYM4_9MYRT|nr:hypothetical protein SAY87_001787 [Trapa incisa]